MNRLATTQNPIVSAATAVGVAGGGVLLAPLAAPAVHGLAGIAVVGLGVYATGTAVFNASRFLNEKTSGILGEGASMLELLKGAAMSKPNPKLSAKEVPFRRQ